jgi:Glycine cleavage system protein P (pyridoxal-binding), N-terminal domain
MGNYIPSTSAEQQEMLNMLGFSSLNELYRDIPQELMLKGLNIPAGKSELEVRKIMTDLAEKNQVFQSIFRGAGAYHHYIPALVKQITGKEEFVTAYTPYQAEISQGLLQSIFEYQTMMCELTGLDVSNASVYDGATAAAEAVAMCKDRRRAKVLISEALHPMTIQTIQTYCFASDTEMVLVPLKEGQTDIGALEAMLDETVASVMVQQPNYFGLIEDAEEIGKVAHAKGAKYIMSVNPIGAALLKSAGECGADIAVGEGQPLGLPLSFGGPYLGFMTATQELARKSPGRIVGETVDVDGKRAFVLTLQAREQHIRREKASSNICSNQAHCALTASVYLTIMGPDGVREVARQCVAKAHYGAEQITKIKGFKRVHSGEFFHEFLTASPIKPEILTQRLGEKGILGGYPVGDDILWCFTEMNSKVEIDRLVEALEEVSR